MKMCNYYLGELIWSHVKEFLPMHDGAVVPLETAGNTASICQST